KLDRAGLPNREGRRDSSAGQYRGIRQRQFTSNNDVSLRGDRANVAALWPRRYPHIASPVSSRRGPCAACSGIPWPGCCGCSAGKKNGLWSLWAAIAELLRSQAAACPRPVLRGHARVPGGGGPAGPLSTVCCREAGETRLVGRQPLLQQTLRLLCRASVS